MFSFNSFLVVPLLALAATACPTPGGDDTDSHQKAVVAHHIVGFTYSYQQSDWLNDIKLANSSGIDAFALNFGRDSWQPERIANAYAAAEQHGPDFKLFLSFDMTSLYCNQGDAQNLRNFLNQYANHPNQFWYKGRPYVSTFGGENCYFGTESVNSGWTSAVRTGVNQQYNFVPSFFVDPATFPNYPVVDGDFNWNGGWPMSNTDETFDDDRRHILGNSGKIFMAAASPWFSTHYNYKNWIFRGDDWLWNTRWEQLMTNRDQVDIVEIVTWNDYSESHYIAPLNADTSLPPDTKWVNGMDHQAWLQMVPYYAQAFKTGVYPDITEDHIYMWSRPHAAGANACCDSVSRPDNWEWTSDYLWAVVFASSPGSVNLSSGSNTQSFEVTAGVNKLKMPNSVGGIRASLTRNGADIITVDPGSSFTYTQDPREYNFNAFTTWA